MSLTEREEFILRHISRCGSDGYGAFVTKMQGRWFVHGYPKAFKTKREATDHFEAYLGILRNRKAGMPVEGDEEETG
jgi:hypothetical protein